jgi:hypothetical protein
MDTGSMTSSKSSTLTLKNKTKTNHVPIYKKYAKTAENNWLDPSSRLKPSDLSKPALNLVADDYPMIIEFNNIQDNTGNNNFYYFYSITIFLYLYTLSSTNTFVSRY